MNLSPDLFADGTVEYKPYNDYFQFNYNYYTQPQMLQSICTSGMTMMPTPNAHLKDIKTLYLAQISRQQQYCEINHNWNYLCKSSYNQANPLLRDLITKNLKESTPKSVNRIGVKERMRLRNRQLKAEGKPLLPQANKTLPAELKVLGKWEVQKLLAECAKTPTLLKLGARYWKTWLRVASTDWNSKPNPELTRQKINTHHEKTPFYRKSSSLVVGSVFDKIEPKKEYQRIEKFAKKRVSIEERRQILKKKYLKQREEVFKSQNNIQEVLMAKIRMLNHQTLWTKVKE